MFLLVFFESALDSSSCRSSNVVFLYLLVGVGSWGGLELPVLEIVSLLMLFGTMGMGTYGDSRGSTFVS